MYLCMYLRYFRMKIKKPVLSLHLRTTNPLSDGRYPVCIRATYGGKRQYYSLGIAATADEWDSVLCRLKARRLSEAQRKANHLLDDYAGRLRDLEQDFERVEFTFDKFKTKFFSPDNSSVIAYFDRVISELEDQDRLGSARAYKNTRDKLKAFRKDFTFLDVDKKFLQRFEVSAGKTCSPATVGIYLRTLRAVYNRAITDNLVKRDTYPFADYKIKAVRSRKKALSREQMDTLKAYEAPDGSRLADSLNLFLFSYYGRGMNLTDMANLKWSHVRNGRIYYQRQKTADLLDLAIDSNLAKLLTRYPGEGYIFGILTDGLPSKTIRYRIHAKLKRVNEDLRTIVADIENKAKMEGEETGLPEDITFYWARHSYATVLKRAGVSISVIQETLGHSSEQVTKNYLDSFETSELDKISALL